MNKAHVHILMSCPQTLALSEIRKRIKGWILSKLFEVYPYIKMRYCGSAFWARGYLRYCEAVVAEDDQAVFGALL